MDKVLKGLSAATLSPPPSAAKFLKNVEKERDEINEDRFSKPCYCDMYVTLTNDHSRKMQDFGLKIRVGLIWSP